MSRISAAAGSIAVVAGGRAFGHRNGKTVPFDGDTEAEGVRLSDDGLTAAVWSKSGVRLVDVVSGARIREWRTERPARRVRFALDGSLLATERGGGVAALPRDGGAPTTAISPPGLPLDALLSTSGDRLAVCDRDEKIRVCRYPQVHEVISFCLGHEEFVSSIEPLPHEPDLLASASGDGTVRIWDPSVGRELLSLEIDRREAQEPIERVVCSSSGNSSLMIVSPTLAESVSVYRIDGPRGSLRCERLRTVHLGSKPIGLAADGEELRALVSNTKIKGWNLLSGEPLPDVDFEGPDEIDRTEEEISHLYKRKVDNLREYRERKRRRLEGR